MSADTTMRALTEAIERDLERFRVYHGFSVLNGRMREPKRVQKLLEGIREDIATALALVQPDTLRHLDLPARILTLIAALEQMTIARGNHIYQVDALHECAMQFMPDDVRNLWRTIGPHKLAGHIAHQSEVAEQLEARGILVWQGDDHLIRLVNINWLKTHAAIREHVTMRVIGRRCQFCGIQEGQSSRELIPVDPAKRGQLEIANGAVQLQTRTVHTHAKCAPHWSRFLAIAERYKTQAEAEAADIEAGRTQQPVPEMQLLEAPAADETNHFSSKEQGR